MGATLLICLLGYQSIPEVIPRQIGLDGQVTSTFAKSPLTVVFPALVLLFIDAMLTFSHWSILRSKRPVDPAAPAATNWAYAMFARTQSILLVAGGVIVGFVGVAMALSFVGAISIGQAAVICLVCVMALALGSVAVSVIYGQNGSRLIAKVAVGGPIALTHDNDAHWKAGIFYFNPQDPSLFLPERFGIGWTLNWGRPAAWAIMAALLAVVVAFIAFALTL